MSVMRMRYRKGSSDILTTIVLNYSKSAEQANIVFKAYDINSIAVENKLKFWSMNVKYCSLKQSTSKEKPHTNSQI